MPNRVIREAILDSQRYWSVPIEAQRLFFHLMLLADDFACVSLAPVFIGRRCFDVRPAPAKLEGTIERLAAADLVRIYYSGSSESPSRFAFIPRFRQVLRIKKNPKHPLPPLELYEDDPAALENFSKSSALFQKMPSTRTTPAVHVQRTRTPEVEVESNTNTKGESEAEGKGESGGRDASVPILTTVTAAQALTKPPFYKNEPQNPETRKTVWQWAHDFSMSPRPEESSDQFKGRIMHEIALQAHAGHKSAAAWLKQFEKQTQEAA